jgi:thioredoxin-like negative regulator of GroEL
MSPIELTDSSYQKFLQEHELVIVKFGASWCGSCVLMDPAYEALAMSDLAREQKKLAWARVDIDKAEKLTIELGILSVPVLVLFRRTREVGRLFGEVEAKKIQKFIEENL